MQIVILSGGLGTRLYPLTKNIPKAMIEINGKPFIDHQLKYLQNNGFTKFHFCLGFGNDQIKSYVEDSTYKNISTFTFDGNKPLGTGGALIKARDKLDDVFCLTYGDTILPIEYEKPIEFFKKNSFNILLTIYNGKRTDHKKNILFENNKIKFYTKKTSSTKLNYIEYGFMIWKKKILNEYTIDKNYDLVEIISNFISKDSVGGFVINDTFYDIGNFKSLETTSKFIKEYLS